MSFVNALKSSTTLLPMSADAAVRLVPTAAGRLGWRVTRAEQAKAGSWSMELSHSSMRLADGVSLSIDSPADFWTRIQMRPNEGATVTPAARQVFFENLLNLGKANVSRPVKLSDAVSSTASFPALAADRLR